MLELWGGGEEMIIRRGSWLYNIVQNWFIEHDLHILWADIDRGEKPIYLSDIYCGLLYAMYKQLSRIPRLKISWFVKG